METLLQILYEALTAAAQVDLVAQANSAAQAAPAADTDTAVQADAVVNTDSAAQIASAADSDAAAQAASAASSLPLLIRRAYTNPAPPPEPGRDVLYYDLTPVPRVPHTEEAPPPEGGLEYFRAAPWRLNLVFYGDSALSLAWRFYHLMYLDGPGNPRQLLRRAGIYPVPGGPGPTLIREEWQKGRRTRADLILPLMIAETLVLAPEALPPITAPPTIQIHVTA